MEITSQAEKEARRNIEGLSVNDIVQKVQDLPPRDALSVLQKSFFDSASRANIQAVRIERLSEAILKLEEDLKKSSPQRGRSIGLRWQVVSVLRNLEKRCQKVKGYITP